MRPAVPKAYVVLAARFDPSESAAESILGFARERLAPFQRIRRSSPWNCRRRLGKIHRVELREREEAVAAGDVVVVEWCDDQFTWLTVQHQHVGPA